MKVLFALGFLLLSSTVFGAKKKEVFWEVQSGKDLIAFEVERTKKDCRVIITLYRPMLYGQTLVTWAELPCDAYLAAAAPIKRLSQ